MRRLRACSAVVVTLLLVGSSSCSDVRDRTGDALGAAAETSDRVRFCLSLARAVSAVESTSPDTAQDAVEEAVAQAPDELLEDVRAFAERIRAIEQAGPGALEDPELQAAAKGLRDRTRELCDPTT